MHRDSNSVAARRCDESGQTMAEYAVVLSVITVAILLSFQLIGDSAAEVINNVIDRLPG